MIENGILVISIYLSAHLADDPILAMAPFHGRASKMPEPALDPL